jgi:RNA polymerase sigma-70 factor (ECF subfamily)
VTDPELIQRAQQGDPHAIGELYLAHHEQTYKYICSRVGDPALAEDLTGEVFVRVVTRLPSYQDTGVPFQAWLYRIAHNLLMDHFRKTNRTFAVQLEPEGTHLPMQENPASQVETQLTLEHLQRVLTQMDTEQAEVIRLRFMVGLPIKDVAERLGKTVAAIKAIQHRGVITLRAVLQ